MSTSHEWAKKLEETAAMLRSRPNVDMDGDPKILASFYGHKDKFLAVVRALKPGRKRVDESPLDYINFYPDGTVLNLYINRDLFCHKVREAEYKCEPLLSPEEDAEMESAETEAK